MGVSYKTFHWTPDFSGEDDSPRVPIWLTLPGLPPNYFHVSIFRSIGGGFGRFLKRDNVTACHAFKGSENMCRDGCFQTLKAILLYRSSRSGDQ
ncbi:hypothetical protein I3760_06G068500 [Carya illinoinensis]|nr:hypothetical protein I3760_06G068500 [Carya illinoinensis]